MAITRHAKAEADKVGKPATRSGGKTTTSRTAAKAAKAKSETQKKAAAKSSNKTPKALPARKQPPRAKKQVDESESDDDEQTVQTPESPKRKDNTPIVGAIVPRDEGGGNNQNTTDDKDSHEQHEDEAAKTIPVPPRSLSPPPPPPPQALPARSATLETPSPPHNGLLLRDEGSPTELWPISPLRESPPPRGFNFLSSGFRPLPKPKPRQHVPGTDYNADDNFIISRPSFARHRRSHPPQFVIDADAEQNPLQGAVIGNPSHAEQDVGSGKKNHHLPSHDMDENGYIDYMSSPVRRKADEGGESQEEDDDEESAGEQSDKEESGSSGSDFSASERERLKGSRGNGSPDMDGRDETSDQEEEEEEEEEEKQVVKSRTKSKRTSTSKKPKPRQPAAAKSGKGKGKEREQPGEEEEEDDDDAGPSHGPKSNKASRRKGKAKAVDDDGGDDAPVYKPGPISKEVEAELIAIEAERDEKVAALAKRCGKHVKTLHAHLGDRARILNNEYTAWNAYQVRASVLDPNNGRYTAGKYSQYVRQNFLADVGPDLEELTEAETYERLPGLRDWITQFQEQLVIDLRDQGTLKDRVRKEMVPLIKMAKNLQDRFGLFVLGWAIDPMGEASVSFGVGEEYEAVMNARKLNFQAQVREMQADFYAVQTGRSLQVVAPTQLRERVSQQAKPSHRDQYKMDFTQILANGLLPFYRDAGQLSDREQNDPDKFQVRWKKNLIEGAWTCQFKIINYPRALEEINLIMGTDNWKQSKLKATTLQEFVPDMAGGEPGCMAIVPWSTEEKNLPFNEQGEIGVVITSDERVLVRVKECTQYNKRVAKEAQGTKKRRAKGQGRDRQPQMDGAPAAGSGKGRAVTPPLTDSPARGENLVFANAPSALVRASPPPIHRAPALPDVQRRRRAEDFDMEPPPINYNSRPQPPTRSIPYSNDNEYHPGSDFGSVHRQYDFQDRRAVDQYYHPRDPPNAIQTAKPPSSQHASTSTARAPSYDAARAPPRPPRLDLTQVGTASKDNRVARIPGSVNANAGRSRTTGSANAEAGPSRIAGSGSLGQKRRYPDTANVEGERDGKRHHGWQAPLEEEDDDDGDTEPFIQVRLFLGGDGGNGGEVNGGLICHARSLQRVAQSSAVDLQTAMMGKKGAWTRLPPNTTPVLARELDRERWQKQREMWGL
ncbi:hypothetical protein R3P38DRAFT_2812256 [Favolaschia claudopus]|uniref:Uncharacterized protein n=1 Tax=Favolaschia claudopus TaxID=2862362 RepID=A0AAV9Z7M1_9AGAR